MAAQPALALDDSAAAAEEGDGLELQLFRFVQGGERWNVSTSVSYLMLSTESTIDILAADGTQLARSSTDTTEK